jgi:hypothetical protein
MAAAGRMHRWSARVRVPVVSARVRARAAHHVRFVEAGAMRGFSMGKGGGRLRAPLMMPPVRVPTSGFLQVGAAGAHVTLRLGREACVAVHHANMQTTDGAYKYAWAYYDEGYSFIRS